MKRRAAEYLCRNCIEESRKKVLLISDNTTREVSDIFYQALISCEKDTQRVELDCMCSHGEEPVSMVADRMLENEAVMCLTRYSLAHTKARKRAEDKGIAFLSMPEYNTDMLCSRAIYADYELSIPYVKKYADFFTYGRNVAVETEKGTALFMDIEGRRGNCCPGVTTSEYLLGSPPDIEANVAPIESRTNGRLVVDASITDPRIGLLDDIVVLDVKEGVIQEIFSPNKQVEYLLNEIFQNVKSPKAYIIGEFGIGFNDSAQLCGNMLIDEGVKGCVHFGIGSNWTIGGLNMVNFHLDFVIRKATVKIDNKTVIEKGELLYGN